MLDSLNFFFSLRMIVILSFVGFGLEMLLFVLKNSNIHYELVLPISFLFDLFGLCPLYHLLYHLPSNASICSGCPLRLVFLPFIWLASQCSS